MKLVGTFIRSDDGHRVSTVGARNSGNQPYVFVNKALARTDLTTADLNLGPWSGEDACWTDPPNTLYRNTRGDPDDFLLWFVAASHKRFRIRRSEGLNAVSLLTGAWGSAAILLCSKHSSTCEAVFTLVKTDAEMVRTTSIERYCLDPSTGTVLCSQETG